MYDVIIIGAGPAGLAAAIECRSFELKTVILDEFPKPGGRLLGQLHEEPNGEWWNGIKEAEQLYERAKPVENNVSVHHIENKNNYFIVHTNTGHLKTKTVLIATGAAESAVPIPGWTLPGVMSIGAAQVMTNVHRVRVGEKGIIVGVNVLAAAIARELQLAGIELERMALPAKNIVNADASNPLQVMESLIPIAHLAPSAFIKFGSKFAKARFIQRLAVQFFPKRGVKMWDIPIQLRQAVVRINGTEKVESVTTAHITSHGDIIKGTEKEIPVDFVCIAGGLYPLAELAAVVHCPFVYEPSLGGHVPVHNEAMETPVDGVFVAGNITGIESAQVARDQGTVAGLSIVQSIRKAEKLTDRMERAITKVKETRDQATIQFHPQIKQGRTKMNETYSNVTSTE